MGANEIETLQFSCTTCPSECLLTVEVKRGADGAVAEGALRNRQQLPTR